MTQRVRPVQRAFLRLHGEHDWASAARREQIFFDEALGGLRLGDENATAILPTEPAGTFGGVTRPTGLAVGPDGRLFVADPTRSRLVTYTTQQAAFVPLWEARTTMPPDAYTLHNPRGVAMSRDGDLVVADTGHGRVIIYTWPGLAVRHIIDLDNGEPWDLAYDSRGSLYVADAAAGRIHRFDRLWRRDPHYVGGTPVLNTPRHLAIDTADRLLVLDTSLRQLVELNAQGHPQPAVEPHVFQRGLPPPLRLDTQGLWLLQDDRPNCPALLLHGLQVDRRGRVLGLGVTLLARPASVNYPRTGRLISPALDSGIYNCAWHRLVLDVDLPAATSVTIRTLTAPAELEPSRLDSIPDNQWATALSVGPDDWPEVLVQSPPGRFLWVEVVFNGNGAATPLARAITIYAPRTSSLQFLPPVFHEDAVSANFLDRLLSYFDTVFDEIESQIERFSGYLDPDGVPAGDFLPWLGSWLDLTFLAAWPESTRRELVRQAISLYTRRGTIAGLQAIVRLHTGLQPPHPIIIEHFRLRDYHTRRQTGVADLVDNTLYLAGLPLEPAAHALAHHFTMLLPNQAVPDADALTLLHRLIAAQKPAHTQYQLLIVEPGLRIGCQSSVGIDTLIGTYPAAPLGDMGLAQSSQLVSPMRLDPRLGASRLLFG